MDAFVADLPISGGTCTNKTKEHFTPTINGENLGSPSAHLNYRTTIPESLRALMPGNGCASFISVDANSLKHGMLSYQSYWMPLLEQNKMTLGGLPGIFFCIERRPCTTKNVSMWLDAAGDGTDLSSNLRALANDACSGYGFDAATWELVKASDNNSNGFDFVRSVELVDVFQSETNNQQRTSHCYRMEFHPLLSNQQSKVLEQVIRTALVQNPIVAGQELR